MKKIVSCLLMLFFGIFLAGCATHGRVVYYQHGPPQPIGYILTPVARPGCIAPNGGVYYAPSYNGAVIYRQAPGAAGNIPPVYLQPSGW